MTKVLYPGSFDPMTKGHMNIVEQASQLFDEVIIAVLQNPLKGPGFFTLEERMEIIQELIHRMNNVKVISGNGAAVDLAILHECNAIIRGLRGISNFDEEIGLLQWNREQSNHQVNTVFFYAEPEYQYVSSSVVRETFRLDKDISQYVEPIVETQMIRKRRLVK